MNRRSCVPHLVNNSVMITGIQKSLWDPFFNSFTHRQPKPKWTNGPMSTEKLLPSKGSDQHSRRAAYTPGQNTCKPHIWEGVNIQNIHGTFATQKQRKITWLKNIQKIWIGPSPEDRQMAKIWKKHSSSPITRDTVTNITATNHLAPGRAAVRKTNAPEHVLEIVEKEGRWVLCW
jgi:hypothetical protein